MSYIKDIAGQKMQIGEYTDYKNQYEVRVKVFTLEVVGLNKEYKQKTSEEYLTKLAMGLIYRLIKVERYDLIDNVIDSLFESGYTLAGYKSKLFKHTVLAAKEQGITLADPIKSKQVSYKA